MGTTKKSVWNLICLIISWSYGLALFFIGFLGIMASSLGRNETHLPVLIISSSMFLCSLLIIPHASEDLSKKIFKRPLTPKEKIFVGLIPFLLLILIGILSVSNRVGTTVKMTSVQCPDGSTSDSLENCSYAQANDMINTEKEKTVNVSDSNYEKIENGLKKCDFSNKNLILDDFVLKRDELPMRFKEKNSWGDYTIELRTPQIKTNSNNENVSRSIRSSFERIYMDVKEYKSVEKASDYLALRYNEVRKEKRNIKKETGEYGEERLEYARDSPYGITSYPIYFRIKNFVVIVDETGAFASPDNVIFIARAMHNKLCTV